MDLQIDLSAPVQRRRLALSGCRRRRGSRAPAAGTHRRRRHRPRCACSSWPTCTRSYGLTAQERDALDRRFWKSESMKDMARHPSAAPTPKPRPCWAMPWTRYACASPLTPDVRAAPVEHRPARRTHHCASAGHPHFGRAAAYARRHASIRRGDRRDRAAVLRLLDRTLADGPGPTRRAADARGARAARGRHDHPRRAGRPRRSWRSSPRCSRRACVSNDSPKFLAFIPGAPTKASQLFDVVVSASAVYGGSWLEGSGAVFAENQALRWVRGPGRPARGCGRVLRPPAARRPTSRRWSRRARPRAARRGGDRPARWRVALGDQAHSSLEKHDPDHGCRPARRADR